MPKRSFPVVVMVILGICLIGCCKNHGTFTPAAVQVKEDLEHPGTWMVLTERELVYQDCDGRDWLAPPGTLTDGASVPRIFLPLTNGRFDRRFLKAAIVHDAYCQKENQAVCLDQYQRRPWQDVHRMFFSACLAGGTPPDLAGAMFAAVWLLGPKWNDPANDLSGVPRDILQVGVDAAAEYIRTQGPNLDEIVQWLDRREPTLRRVSEIDSDTTHALESRGQENTESDLRSADAALEEALADLPNEAMANNLRALHYSRRAETLIRLGRTDAATREIDRAEQSFEKVLRRQPDNPSAVSGLELIRSRAIHVADDSGRMIERPNVERTAPTPEQSPRP